MIRQPPTAGHALIKLVALTLALFLVIGVIYYVLMQISRALDCGEHLARIHQALELYELNHGALPRLSLFPDEPTTDPDSIRVALEAYGVDPDAWICPSSPASVANTGLSYIWNTRLNGGNLRSYAERQWVLIEINALSSDVPAPHLGFYNVLYSDGTVERVRDPAAKLRGL